MERTSMECRKNQNQRNYANQSEQRENITRSQSELKRARENASVRVATDLVLRLVGRGNKSSFSHQSQDEARQNLSDP